MTEQSAFSAREHVMTVPSARTMVSPDCCRTHEGHRPAVRVHRERTGHAKSLFDCMTAGEKPSASGWRSRSTSAPQPHVIDLARRVRLEPALVERRDRAILARLWPPTNDAPRSHERPASRPASARAEANALDRPGPRIIADRNVRGDRSWTKLTGVVKNAASRPPGSWEPGPGWLVGKRH